MPKAKLPRRPLPPAAHRRRAWVLVVVDQEPIRREAVAAYRRADERTRELRGIAERFHTRDRPAFGAWLAATFGALLTELREVEARIDQQGPLLDAVRLTALFGGCSPGDAYDEIMRDKAAFERREARRAAGEASPEEVEEENTDPDDPFKELAGEMERLFGFAPPGGKSSPKPPGGSEPPKPPPIGARGQRRSSRSNPGPTAEQEAAEQHLKAAYRAVVRRLHPDRRAEISEYDRQLWHDAQGAYARRDPEHLETILALSELNSTGTLPTGVGLGGLLSMVRHREATVSKLEQQVRSLTKDPAWNFTLLAAKDKLVRRVGNRLRQDVAIARADLAAIEADLERCRQAPRQPKKSPGRGKRKATVSAANRRAKRKGRP